VITPFFTHSRNLLHLVSTVGLCAFDGAIESKGGGCGAEYPTMVVYNSLREISMHASDSERLTNPWRGFDIM